MPQQASGIFKQVAFKRETTYGTIPSGTAQLLRRVQSTIDLQKDTYQSSEIRPDMQVADYRHGVRRVKGSLQGELSPKTYSDLLSSVLKRDFSAGVAMTANANCSLAISWASKTATINRSGSQAGSWLTDGFKVGDVIRLTGMTTAANNNKNLLVTGITSATVLTAIVLNGTSMSADAATASAIAAVAGKKTWIPTTGHTDVSYTVEHWFNDISQSEAYTGIKFEKVAFDLPPTGMAKISLDAIGQDMTGSQTRQFSSPTAVTDTGVVAAVNGILLVNGVAQATVTGLQINISSALSGDPVVGSNTVPNLFPGTVNVTGQFTAYFTDNVLRDIFVKEAETSIAFALTSDNTANSDVVSFTLPRIKLGGQQKSDGTGGIVQTFPFQALLNTNGGAGTSSEKTTIVVQDTAA